MILEARGISHTYMKSSPLAREALHGVDLGVSEGEFIGIIGRTGSGKSTLVQHLNGLLRPDSGHVLLEGKDIWARGVSLREVRRKVGLVFQYPEHQLFEETVYRDIAFGPRNMGWGEEQVLAAVRDAMAIVGLDFDELKDRSPFELSGGQKRRAAIAGVLAMQPRVLILDEPTAGMDPRGREEVLGQIRKIHHDLGYTVILVSHSMEEIARLADRLIVMDHGRIVMSGPPGEIFDSPEVLCCMGLGVPQVTQVTAALRAKGLIDFNAITVEEARDRLIPLLSAKRQGRP